MLVEIWVLIISVFITPFFLIGYKLFSFYPEKPILRETWWSNEDPAKENKNIYPFKINISQQILDELNFRLHHTRPFTKPLQDNQMYGFNSEFAQEFLNYWKTEYNWRKRESMINKFPQFITNIQGLNIHFVHYKPKNINDTIKVLPLLMAHGWPSSFREFLDVLPRLTTPREGRDFVFEVVVPSVPGYGFSDAAQKPGMGAAEVGLIFKNLMNRLGFDRFYLQGGDIGHLITKSISTSFEESVLGFHSNMCISLHPYSLLKYVLGSIYPNWIKRKSHRELYYPISSFVSTLLMESGYLHQQATKPDTFGIAIDDSPIGMAVHYLEKFSSGSSLLFQSRRDGGLKEKYSYDDLLDNIMIYWVTKTGTTSFRFYSETFHGNQLAAIIWLPVEVPTACLRGPLDIISPDGMVEDTFPNIVHRGDYEVGHFIGFENPGLLADDLFEAVTKMEEVNKDRCKTSHE